MLCSERRGRDLGFSAKVSVAWLILWPPGNPSVGSHESGQAGHKPFSLSMGPACCGCMPVPALSLPTSTLSTITQRLLWPPGSPAPAGVPFISMDALVLAPSPLPCSLSAGPCPLRQPGPASLPSHCLLFLALLYPAPPTPQTQNPEGLLPSGASLGSLNTVSGGVPRAYTQMSCWRGGGAGRLSLRVREAPRAAGSQPAHLGRFQAFSRLPRGTSQLACLHHVSDGGC